MNLEKKIGTDDAAQARAFLASLTAGLDRDDLGVVIFSLPDRRTRRFAVTDLDQTADHAVAAAAHADVYVGVGLQRMDREGSGRGSADDVVAIPGLWVDLDIAGPAHAGDDLPPDRDAARALLDDLGIKPTMVVDSGHGLHLWVLFDAPWVFADDRERQAAARLAKAFQARLGDAARVRGWRIDSTADLSRVLRVPGTRNHKVGGDVRPVRLVEHDDQRRYPRDQLQRRFADAPPTTVVTEASATADPVRVVGEDARRYAQAVLRNQAAHMAAAREGVRHTTLVRSAFVVGQVTDTGGLDPDDVEQQLVAAALGTGLEPEEAVRTFTDGFAAGRARPRPAPPLGTDRRELLNGLVDTSQINQRRFQPAGQFVFEYDPAEDEPLWGYSDQILHISGEALMLASRTGVGKTTLLQQYCLRRVGLVQDPLAGLPVRPLDDGKVVLYIAADRPRQIRRSFERMVAPDDLELLDARMRMWRGPLGYQINRDPSRFEQHLRQLEEQFECAIGEVIIDSLRDVASDLSKDEGGAGVSQGIQELIANDREVVAAHHQRKGERGAAANAATIDDIYGSTFLTACMGSVLFLHGTPGATHLELRHLKMAAEEVGPVQLSHDKANGSFSVRQQGDLLETLQAAPEGLTVRLACSLLYAEDEPDDDLRERTRRKLEKLVSAGYARRGDAQPGKAMTYLPVNAANHNGEAGA